MNGATGSVGSDLAEQRILTAAADNMEDAEFATGRVSPQNYFQVGPIAVVAIRSSSRPQGVGWSRGLSCSVFAAASSTPRAESR